MEHISKVQIRSVSQRTGLREGTVQDLLRSGWQYTETMNQMPRWQRPDPEVSNG